MNYKDEQIKRFREKWRRIEKNMTGHISGRKIWDVSGGDDEDSYVFVEESLESLFKESMERAYLKGKLTAYENVVAWTEQCDPSNEMALSAHRAAVSSTEDDLTQSGEKE